MIRQATPDIVILDWEMPLLNGAELVRIVRSPGVFPMPDIPIIMLTAHGERWRIVESLKLGVNEFLCKPVSAKALLDRLISILLKPRASVQLGDYYGPAPRLPTLARKAGRCLRYAARGLTPSLFARPESGSHFSGSCATVRAQGGRRRGTGWRTQPRRGRRQANRRWCASRAWRSASAR